MNGRARIAVLIAAALGRLAHLAAVRDAPFVRQLALDSQEYDRWARAIAGGEWWGSTPFFQAPLYPYLVAVVYRLVGPGALSVYFLQIAAAVAGCWALMQAGERLSGPRTGLVAGALFALYTPFWFYDALLLKESLAVSLVCFLLFALVRADSERGSSSWFLVGLLSALLALLRENMLLVIPFLLPLAWRGSGSPERASGLRRTALLLLGLALPLAPVAARNAALGGGFLPTTSQGGVNLWIGNNPTADGTYRPLVPGKQIPSYEREGARILAEQAAGRALAPNEVSAFWAGRVGQWARDDPWAFFELQLRKLRLYGQGYEWPDAVDYYWMKSLSLPLSLPLFEWASVALLALWGLWLERSRLSPWAPVWLFEIGWMFSVVVFFLFARYRLPAVPGLLLLAAIPIERAFAAFDRERAKALWMTAGVCLLWGLPHLAGHAPRTELVEFNLGRLAEERGDAAAAKSHYLRTLEAAPTNLSALLNLGTLAARAGDYVAARARFEAAVEVAPDSDDAHANLGAACLALGELETAEHELNGALERNPENAFAKHNLEVLQRRVAAAARFAQRSEGAN